MMWSNYIKGTLQALMNKFPDIKGANLVVTGNVPQGAGLSSSASFEIVILKAFRDLYQLDLDGVSAALIGQQAENNFGRPALMLSGGGTFGIFHNGVIRALLEHDLLPNIISGTSMGSITAGILATHHNHEVKALLRNPDNSHYSPLKKSSIRSAWAQKALLDPQQLQECLETNYAQLRARLRY